MVEMVVNTVVKQHRYIGVTRGYLTANCHL